MTTPTDGERHSFAGLSLDFWTFWAGQAISTLGTSFTVFAMPLLIFKLTGSALNLSVSMAVSYVPYLLFGLVVGAWVDRLDRKLVMMVSNIVLAASIGSVPVMDAFHHLSVDWIYAAQFISATVRLFFTSASFAAIPNLVSRDQLVAANGRMQASYSALSVVGPLLAGALAAFVPLPSLLLVDAASYVLAGAALLFVRRDFSPMQRTQESGIRQDIAEGLRFLMGHPVLRNISIMMALVNFVSMTVAAQLVYFAKVQLHASNTMVGLLFAANAVGIFALSMLAGPLRRHWPFSRVALGLLEIQGVVTLLIAQLHLFWAVVPLMALWQGLGILFSINTTSLRQTVTPSYLLGRVVSTANVLSGSVIPLGTLAGGIAIQKTNNITLVYSVIGALVFFIPVVFSFTALGRAEQYLPREEGAEPTPPSEPSEIGRWVEAASHSTPNGEDGESPLGQLSDDEVAAVQSNLEALYGSSSDMSLQLSRAPKDDPSGLSLEATLKQVHDQVEAINFHWNEIADRIELDGSSKTALESNQQERRAGRR
ncbi:MAG TPA: MFS transporter [Chloroflexota bacterium]